MIKAIVAAIFLAPLVLSAQTTYRFNAASACPVGLRAQHISDGTMVNTRDGKKQETAQRLHLSFSKTSHPIARATMNVSGWTVESRFEQTVAKSAKHGDGQDAGAVRTVTAQVTDGTADVWVPGLTGVSSIELVSLEYADGSTWTPSGADSCRFVPDPLMLIAGR